MERLVLDGLWQHVKENNIIHGNQHGFEKNCSFCVTQLIECLNDWIADYDKGLQTDIINHNLTIPNDISVVKRRNFIYRMLFTDIYYMSVNNILYIKYKD